MSSAKRLGCLRSSIPGTLAKIAWTSLKYSNTNENLGGGLGKQDVTGNQFCKSENKLQKKLKSLK